MSKTYQTIAGVVAAALLAVPAFGQSPRPLPMNDCTKILPAGQDACAKDNVLRTDCNKVSNPAQCYNNAKAGKPVAKPAETQPAKPAAAQPAKPVAAQPAKPVATQPVKPAAQAIKAAPAKCTGSMFTKPVKNFKTLAELNRSGYLAPENLAAANPTAAATECSAKCAAMGEPAPCGWYTVVKWRDDFANKMAYQCFMVNARSAKGIFVPKLANDINLGIPAQPLYFQEAQSYPCTR